MRFDLRDEHQVGGDFEKDSPLPLSLANHEFKTGVKHVNYFLQDSLFNFTDVRKERTFRIRSPIRNDGYFVSNSKENT